MSGFVVPPEVDAAAGDVAGSLQLTMKMTSARIAAIGSTVLIVGMVNGCLVVHFVQRCKLIGQPIPGLLFHFLVKYPESFINAVVQNSQVVFLRKWNKKGVKVLFS
jgi:hypothetical protein